MISHNGNESYPVIIIYSEKTTLEFGERYFLNLIIFYVKLHQNTSIRKQTKRIHNFAILRLFISYYVIWNIQ